MKRASRSALFIEGFPIESFTQLDPASDMGPIKSIIFQNHQRFILTDKGDVWKVNSSLQVENSPSRESSLCNLVMEFNSIKIRTLQCSAEIFLAISDVGVLYCWGKDTNNSGLLGLGSMRIRQQPTAVTSTIKFKFLSMSNKHAAAIDEKGNLYTWGTGKCGELGHPHETYISRPSKVESVHLLTCQHVAAYKNLTIAITGGGSLLIYGQISQDHQNYENKEFKPYHLQLGQKVFAMDAVIGERFAACLTRKGEIYVISENLAYQKINCPHTFKSICIKHNRLYALSEKGTHLLEWEYTMKSHYNLKHYNSFISSQPSSSNVKIIELADEFTKNPQFNTVCESASPIILFETTCEESLEESDPKSEDLYQQKREKRVRLRPLKHIVKGRVNSPSSHERAQSAGLQSPTTTSFLDKLKSELANHRVQPTVKDTFFHLDLMKGKTVDYTSERNELKTEGSNHKKQVLQILEFNSRENAELKNNVDSKTKRIEELKRNLKLHTDKITRNKDLDNDENSDAIISKDSGRYYEKSSSSRVGPRILEEHIYNRNLAPLSESPEIENNNLKQLKKVRQETFGQDVLSHINNSEVMQQFFHVRKPSNQSTRGPTERIKVNTESDDVIDYEERKINTRKSSFHFQDHFNNTLHTRKISQNAMDLSSTRMNEFIRIKDIVENEGRATNNPRFNPSDYSSQQIHKTSNLYFESQQQASHKKHPSLADQQTGTSLILPTEQDEEIPEPPPKKKSIQNIFEYESRKLTIDSPTIEELDQNSPSAGMAHAFKFRSISFNNPDEFNLYSERAPLKITSPRFRAPSNSKIIEFPIESGPQTESKAQSKADEEMRLKDLQNSKENDTDDDKNSIATILIDGNINVNRKADYSMGSVEHSLLKKLHREDISQKSKEDDKAISKHRNLSCILLCRVLKKKIDKEQLTVLSTLVNYTPPIPKEHTFHLVYLLERVLLKHHLPLVNWGFSQLNKKPKKLQREIIWPALITLHNIIKLRYMNHQRDFLQKMTHLRKMKIIKEKKETGIISMARFIFNIVKENKRHVISKIRLASLENFNKRTKAIIFDKFCKSISRIQRRNALSSSMLKIKESCVYLSKVQSIFGALDRVIQRISRQNLETALYKMKFLIQLRKTLNKKLIVLMIQKLSNYQVGLIGQGFQAIQQASDQMLLTIKKEAFKNLSRTLTLITKKMTFNSLLFHTSRSIKKEKQDVKRFPLAVSLFHICSRRMKESIYALKEHSTVSKLRKKAEIQGLVLKQLSMTFQRKKIECFRHFIDQMKLHCYIEESCLHNRNQEMNFKVKILEGCLDKILVKSKISIFSSLKTKRSQPQKKTQLAAYLRSTLERLYKQKLQFGFEALTDFHRFIIKSIGTSGKSSIKSPLSPNIQIDTDTYPKRGSGDPARSPNFKSPDIPRARVSPFEGEKANISADHSFGDLSKIMNDRSKIRIEGPDINLDDNNLPPFSKSQSLVSLHEKVQNKPPQGVDIFNLSISKTIESYHGSPISRKTERDIQRVLQGGVDHIHSAQPSSKNTTPRAGMFTKAFSGGGMGRVSSLPEIVNLVVPESNKSPSIKMQELHHESLLSKSRSVASFVKAKKINLDDDHPPQTYTIVDKHQSSKKKPPSRETSLRKLREGNYLNYPNESVDEFRILNNSKNYEGDYAEPLELEPKISSRQSPRNPLPAILPSLEEFYDSPEIKAPPKDGHIYGTKIFPFPQYLKKLEKEGKMWIRNKPQNTTKGSIHQLIASTTNSKRSRESSTIFTNSATCDSVKGAKTITFPEPNKPTENPPQSSMKKAKRSSKKSGYFPDGVLSIMDLQIPKAEISLEGYPELKSSRSSSLTMTISKTQSAIKLTGSAKNSLPGSPIHDKKRASKTPNASSQRTLPKSPTNIITPIVNRTPKGGKSSTPTNKTPSSKPTTPVSIQIPPLGQKSAKKGPVFMKPKPPPSNETKPSTPLTNKHILPELDMNYIMETNALYPTFNTLGSNRSDAQFNKPAESFEEFKAKVLSRESDSISSNSIRENNENMPADLDTIQSQIEKRLMDEEKYTTLYNMYKNKDPYRARLYQDMAKNNAHPSSKGSNFEQYKSSKTPRSSQNSAFVTFAHLRTQTEGSHQTNQENMMTETRDRFDDIKQLYLPGTYSQLEQARQNNQILKENNSMGQTPGFAKFMMRTQDSNY